MQVSPQDFFSLDFEAGHVLLFDKPLYWSSFDLVRKVKFMAEALGASKKLKVGHAGTLDPLATGLMIVCTGKATKQIDQLMGMQKHYAGTLVLGAETQSVDLEYPIEPVSTQMPLSEQVSEASRHFVGEIEQFPPIFSALKIGGKRAYDLVRNGVDEQLKARTVQVDQFDVHPINESLYHYQISCSKGTYVRSLIFDLGRKLECGAYVKSLRRTQIGSFDIAKALNPMQLVEMGRSQQIQGF